jgi:hypothetical protein
MEFKRYAGLSICKAKVGVFIEQKIRTCAIR